MKKVMYDEMKMRQYKYAGQGSKRNFYHGDVIVLYLHASLNVVHYRTLLSDVKDWYCYSFLNFCFFQSLRALGSTTSGENLISVCRSWSFFECRYLETQFEEIHRSTF